MAGLAATRFVRLDDAPGEWYGDISTVYEYVVNIRNGTSPNGYHQLGTGALYPAVIRPVLWVLGDSYLSIKTAGAVCSLVGLFILFRLCRRVISTNFALLTTVLAGTSMWWLIFSRLGDVQALTPTLALAAVSCAFATIRNPGVLRWPAACGCLSALGLYLYGNTIVLPLITGLYLVVGWRLKRVTPRTIGVWSICLVATLTPLAIDLIREPGILVEIHLVGTGWSQAGMPEIKSILYAAERPEMIVYGDPDTFDCRSLDTVARPAVLIWRYDTRLPGQGLENCESELLKLATVTLDWAPTFRTARVG